MPNVLGSFTFPRGGGSTYTELRFRYGDNPLGRLLEYCGVGLQVLHYVASVSSKFKSTDLL
jgi:hypothetical protein